MKYGGIKENLCLVVYSSPSELIRAMDEAVRIYNQTPHEPLQNVSPNDVSAGGKEEVLQKRHEKKRLTKERKKAIIFSDKTMPLIRNGQQTSFCPECQKAAEDIQLGNRIPFCVTQSGG